MENSNAVKTPGAIPHKAITIETVKGKRMAPAMGVAATNQRNIRISW
tara:strand:- start:216 stop:356 length:141 start_codon:yes stop_codon:yes gene_type:complete